MLIGRPLARLIDIVTGILAFVMVGVLAFSYINARFGFIRDAGDLAWLQKWREIGVLVVVGLAGLSFVLKRNVVIFILFVLVLATAAVFFFWTL